MTTVLYFLRLQSQCESENGKPHRCTSPIPKLRVDMEKKDDDRVWTKLKHYSPAAFKFYMEQHVENVLKQHKERVSRRIQLEKEMSKVQSLLIMIIYSCLGYIVSAITIRLMCSTEKFF